MPFASLYRPSIQLGLLKSIVDSHEFPTATFHLNLDFAQQIRPALYEHLCQHRGRLYGDWLLSLAAFDEAAPDQATALLDAFPTEVDALLNELKTTRERLGEIRHVEIPLYLDRLMEAIPWQQFRVIGFTSTFQQNAASFALARRIKRRYFDICLLFGGANFEGEMGEERIRSVDCIDYAIVGEGDQTFPELLIALQEGRDPVAVPAGVSLRTPA
jgi:hypothetical protein